MQFVDKISHVLTGLESAFHPNELAYLAATSKVEGPVRDKIAFGLHRALEPGMLVHREWRGRKGRWTDIAITDEENRPKCLIELKAHSGPTFEPGYSDKVRKDIDKLSNAGDLDTELYFIFLFNHLYHPATIHRKFVYSVKYYGLQNSASVQNGFATDVTAYTKRHWERHLQDVGLTLEKGHPCFVIKGGFYHEMPMTVHAYLYGPTFRRELIEHL